MLSGCLAMVGIPTAGLARLPVRSGAGFPAPQSGRALGEGGRARPPVPRPPPPPPPPPLSAFLAGPVQKRRPVEAAPAFADQVQDKLQILTAKALWPVMKALKENCKYRSYWQNSALASGWNSLSHSGRFDPCCWRRTVFRSILNSWKTRSF